MNLSSASNPLIKTTSYKVVLPFYSYAALAFLVATSLLYFSSEAFTQHYFHPEILAITHIMALGWGTMIILGASHQLVPVLVEGKLFSSLLAYVSFTMAASGIPLLVIGFYYFNMGWLTQCGALLINAAILSYLVNLAISMIKSKKENVHTAFIFTAALWLFMTTIIGFLLVLNFSDTILLNDSFYYLPLHAHIGIIGWFLLTVIGVGSRLIPMFLISKYSNTGLLWIIYTIVNLGLINFVVLFTFFPEAPFYFIPATAILIGLCLFGFYCYHCFKLRIRKRIDEQLKTAMLSIAMMIIPLLLLVIIIGLLVINSVQIPLVLIYGFVVFFGWITAMIFAMTFKTLPFIVWNKVYHVQTGKNKTPNPKDLFSGRIFSTMIIFYLLGFILFIVGVYISSTLLIKFASLLLLCAAVLYNWNVLKILSHKSIQS